MAPPAASSSSSPQPPPLDPSLVQRLQRFGAYGRLRQLALRRVAHLGELLAHGREDRIELHPLLVAEREIALEPGAELLQRAATAGRGGAG